MISSMMRLRKYAHRAIPGKSRQSWDTLRSARSIFSLRRDSSRGVARKSSPEDSSMPVRNEAGLLSRLSASAFTCSTRSDDESE